MAFQPVSMTPDRTAGSVIGRNNRQEFAGSMREAGGAAVTFGQQVPVHDTYVPTISRDKNGQIVAEKKSESIFGMLARWLRGLFDAVSLTGVSHADRSAGATPTPGLALPTGLGK